MKLRDLLDTLLLPTIINKVLVYKQNEEPKYYEPKQKVEDYYRTAHRKHLLNTEVISIVAQRKNVLNIELLKGEIK